jgi:hypothetical protein
LSACAIFEITGPWENSESNSRGIGLDRRLGGFLKGNLNGRGRLGIGVRSQRAWFEAPIGIVCLFVLLEIHAEFRSDHQFQLIPDKRAPRNCAIVSSLTFTSSVRGTRARFYPLLDLNSMEPPIGPNSERGYFVALEQLIDGRRMNFQVLGHFFYGHYFVRRLFSLGHFRDRRSRCAGPHSDGSFVLVPLKAKRDMVNHSSTSNAVIAGEGKSRCASTIARSFPRSPNVAN